MQHTALVSGRRRFATSQNQCDQSWRFFALRVTFKAFATMNLPKSPTFLGNFRKGVKIIDFSNEIIFGQLYRHLAIFYLVTLVRTGLHLLCKVPQGRCDQILQNFAALAIFTTSLATFLRVYLDISRGLNLLCQSLYATGLNSLL